LKKKQELLKLYFPEMPLFVMVSGIQNSNRTLNATCSRLNKFEQELVLQEFLGENSLDIISAPIGGVLGLVYITGA